MREREKERERKRKRESCRFNPNPDESRAFALSVKNVESSWRIRGTGSSIWTNSWNERARR